jgi:4-oxalocrotonate tautomerase
MPFVNIRIVKEVIADDPVAKKAAITQQVTSAIASQAGIPEEAVWVVFEEVSEQDWFVGGNRVKELRAGS